MLTPVPEGTIGEIYVGSPHLAREYLKRPDLTAERFRASPFVPGERICKTGDLGRYLASGEIQFVGRTDNQVKLRGFRIELEDVECALLNHAEVREAAVAIKMQGGEERLIAYIVPTPGSVPNVKSVRDHLMARLPTYMIPATFVVFDQLPLTDAGKLDRSALPEPSSCRPPLNVEYKPPSGVIETQMAAMWSDMLGIQSVGINDDFFGLGGDSLLATQLLFRLFDGYGVEVPTDHFQRHPTINAIATFIRDYSWYYEKFPRKSEMRSSVHENRVCLSINQGLLLKTELRREIFGIQPWSANTGFALNIEGPLDRQILEEAVKAIVSRHEALRTTFIAIATVGALQIRGWRRISQGLRNVPIATEPVLRFAARLGSPNLKLEYLDLLGVRAADIDAAIGEITRKAFESRYDYSSALIRGVLVRFGEMRYQLICGVSHLVCDGWSRRIFQKELVANYASLLDASQPELPLLPVQYHDFALWQREQLQGQGLDRLLNYWERVYSEFPILTAFDLPFVRKGDTNLSAAQLAMRSIPSALGDALHSYLRRHGVTLLTLAMLVVFILMQSYTRRVKLTLATPFANRVRQTEHLIGEFATFHVVGISLSGCTTAEDLLQEVKQRILEASIHQDIPSSLLMNILAHKRHVHLPQVRPISCEVIAPPVQNTVGSIYFSGVGRLEMLRHISQPLGPLRFICTNQPSGGVTIAASYDSGRFRDTDIVAMLRDFCIVLEKVLLCPEAKLSELSDLSDVGRF
jgi:acyl carrier protein